MQPIIETRRFDHPDAVLDFANHGRIRVVTLPDGTTGMHAVFEPGWQWSTHEKPLIGNPDACPTHHVGYCLTGELVVRMVDTGAETHIRAGDFFDIPPQHDGYVEGDQRCVCILFAPPH